MEEQKYYVKLPHVFLEYSFTDLFIDSDYINNDYCFQQAIAGKPMFTLHELESIMNGALVRDVGFDDTTEIELVGDIINGYWVNPLIELIPVNDEGV